MSKNIHDIIIIGAGPAGCIAANEIRKLDKNIDVLLIEEHNTIGEPVQCAGLISIEGFNRLGLIVPKKSILNTVYGALFHSLRDNSFYIRANKRMAYVIDRRVFDRYLAKLALKNGAELKLGWKVHQVELSTKDKNGIAKLNIKKGDQTEKIYSKIIIDAEGVKGNIARQCGFKRPRKILPAIQLEFNNIKIDDPELVEMFFGRRLSPGFFSYIIPTSENSARIAVASNIGNVYQFLSYFLKKYTPIKNRLKNASIVEILGGSIITGGPIKKTHKNNILLVGDVAGHVKATTGGGVIMGGLCSKIAAKIAVEAILNDDFTSKTLKKYDMNWKKYYGKEFYVMNMIRSIINLVPDQLIDILFKTINESSITQIIEEYGDMDFQSGVVKKLLISKNLPIFTAKLFYNLFKQIFQF
ncbi:MAG: geranylgeranyl reductase family protein [Candidatus Helarchaeota archaeon]